MENSKINVSFLFGAGAESSFNLFNGKYFAFELFRYLIQNQNNFNRAKQKSITLNSIIDTFNKSIDSSNKNLKNWLWNSGQQPRTSYKISLNYCLEIIKNSFEENSKKIFNFLSSKEFCDSRTRFDSIVIEVLDKFIKKEKICSLENTIRHHPRKNDPPG